jgi:hypothetical protein
MCEDFAPNFGVKSTGYNSPSHISFFTREFLAINNMTVVPHPPYFSLFPLLKIKLKGRHFDTLEVVEEESQAVLNISQNTTSSMHLKMAEALGTVYKRGRGHLVASSPSVRCGADNSASPGNYGWLFV